MKKIIAILVVLTLFFSFTAVSEKTFQRTEKDMEIASLSDDVPNWQVGNNWKYNVVYEGELGSALSYSWTFVNLLFTIESSSGSECSMSISGTVTGEMAIQDAQLIRGKLKDTTISGTCKADKSNIGIKDIDATIQGKLEVANIPIKSFTMIVDLPFSPAFSSVSFPINVGKKWTVPISEVHGKITLSLLNNPIYIDENYGGDNAECTGTESKSVQAGTFSSYRIISNGDLEEWYYAPDAGNVIKAVGTGDRNVDITLISTNYDSASPGAPNRPSTPSGPSSGVPDTQYTYSTSTIDSEGDQVYYWFDWGDGSNSGWKGPYDSGVTCEASKTWGRQGTFSVKVKAKDIEGHESSWSNSLSVKMPKSKTFSLDFFNDLFQRFPMLQRILCNKT